MMLLINTGDLSQMLCGYYICKIKQVWPLSWWLQTARSWLQDSLGSFLSGCLMQLAIHNLTNVSSACLQLG